MKSSGRLLLAVALTLGGLAAAGQTTSWTTGTYVYDGSGNIKNIGAQVYQYDALGRLVSGTVAPSQTQSMTYDAFGNIRTMTTAGIPIAFGVDPGTNRMDRTSDPGVTYGAYAGYDSAGRMTSTLGGLDSFVYDAVDMVTRARVENVTRVYLYTAGDERLASIPVASGVESCLLINGQQICPEWTLRDASARVLRRLEKNGEAWSWKEDYIYAGGTLVAAEVDGPEKTRHFFADHLGTPRLITGSGGTQIAQHTYYPFGGEASSPTQDAEKLKFTGHERDAESLDYMHARYYAPKWGRFLSVDPGGWDKHRPQTWNRYTYAENNPVLKVDPDGRQAVVPGVVPNAGPFAPLGMALYHVQQMRTNPSYRRAATGAVRTLQGASLAMLTGILAVSRPFLVTPSGVVFPGGKNIDLVPTTQGADTGTPWVQIHDGHSDAKAGGRPHTHVPETHVGPEGETRVKRTEHPATAEDIDNADKETKDGKLRPRKDRKDEGDPPTPQPPKP